MLVSHSSYGRDMTPDQFIETAVRLSIEEILGYVASGFLPETVRSFSVLHDYMDANCLGGVCDEHLQPVFEAIFPQPERETFLTGPFMQALGRVQSRLDVWLAEPQGFAHDLRVLQAAREQTKAPS